MKRVDLNVPTPILMGTQYRFWRSEIEHEKSRLRCLAMGREAPIYSRPEIDVLVPSDVFATEFGISKRTLARRLKEMAEQDKAKA
jgi:hypothetical protein